MTAQKYRKQPVVIEAIRVPPHRAETFETWACGLVHIESWMEGTDCDVTVEGIHIPVNTGGTAIAGPGDWIIKGVEGEFYPCPDSVFQATYEAVAVVSTTDVDQDGNHIEAIVPIAELNEQLVDVNQAYGEAMGVANEHGYGMMSLAEVIKAQAERIVGLEETLSGRIDQGDDQVPTDS